MIYKNWSLALIVQWKCFVGIWQYSPLQSVLRGGNKKQERLESNRWHLLTKVPFRMSICTRPSIVPARNTKIPFSNSLPSLYEYYRVYFESQTLFYLYTKKIRSFFIINDQRPKKQLCKVSSINRFCLKALPQFYRLFMKGKLNEYLL